MERFSDYGIDVPENFHGDKKVICPQCSHTRKKKHDPCLSVNGDKKAWHCHNCGWSGGLQEHDQRRLYRPERHPYRRPRPETVRSDLAPWLIQYFEGRGIGCETLSRCKIFGTVHYLHGTGTDTLCMAFPYYRNGELINVKYRDGRKNMAQEKDPEPCLWNIDACKGAETIYITEGEIDALTLIECGFATAVSVDKGAPNPEDADAEKKLECVDRCIDILKNASRLVLVTDKDEPGLRLEKELIMRLGAARCFLTRYPGECKDINDVLVGNGRAAVAEVINNAAPAPVPGLRDFKEFLPNIQNFYRYGNPKGQTTGWPEFDQIFTIQPGSLNVVTGIPQSGKSEWVHAVLVNMIRLLDWKCAIFSPEMLPVENLFANFAEKIIGKSFFGKDRMTPEEVDRALNMCSNAIKPLLPDIDETPTLDDVLAFGKVCVARYGVKALVVDPYNELEHTRPAWMSETEYISMFLGRMRKFARQYGVWVCIVAHPTKLKKDERTRKFPVPTPYDISGSANWWNKPDNCIALWRDYKGKTNQVQVHVQKVKNKGVGTAGTIQNFMWDYKSGRFTPEIEPSPHAADLPQNTTGRGATE